jgi:hypothetical protein
MNSSTARGLAAASLLATTLTALIASGSAAQTAAPEWKTERGNVFECVGDTADGFHVWTSVYENSRYGNTVQVVIGDPDDGLGSSRQSDERFLVDGHVKASVRVDGRRVKISGDADRYGPRTRVYDEYDDAGFLVKTRGWHRQWHTDFTLTYAGRTVSLICDPAFHYDLEVKKIPVT